MRTFEDSRSATAPTTMSDRGRKNRLSRFPLPPNRTGGSPASGSPVGGVRIGTGRWPLGLRSGEHPKDHEEAATSSRPRLGGRQHALGPCPRFGPWLSARVLSAGASPFGHLRRLPIRSHGSRASTFLPPFAPRQLRRFLATMRALTPPRLTRPWGSPRLSRAAFPPFRLQPPREPLLSLCHATPHRRRFTGFPPDSGFTIR